MAPSRIDSLPTETSTTSSIHKLKTSNAASQDAYGHYYPADPITLNLESNYGPMEPDAIGYLQPTTMDTPLEVMHERFEKDGYLFVRKQTKPKTMSNVSLTHLFAGQRLH